VTLDAKALAEHLRNTALPNAEELAALAAASYRITSIRTPLANLPLGASRFGGSPDVPRGFAWPTHRERPLTFLAQLDLSELGAVALPQTGWLLFFYDVAEQPMGFDPIHQGGAKVVYVDASRNDLRRVEHPDVTHAGGPYEPCSLGFTPTVDLPDAEDRLLEANHLGLRGEDSERYRVLTDSLHGFTANTPYHHLLGHPQLIQGDMRGECQLVTQGIYCGDPSGYRGNRAQELLAVAASEWQLLLQLDSDEAGPAWLWGDTGRIYFWIRRSDLATRTFDGAWLILQCSA